MELRRVFAVFRRMDLALFYFGERLIVEINSDFVYMLARYYEQSKSSQIRKMLRAVQSTPVAASWPQQIQLIEALPKSFRNEVERELAEFAIYLKIRFPTRMRLVTAVSILSGLSAAAVLNVAWLVLLILAVPFIQWLYFYSAKRRLSRLEKKLFTT